MDRKRAKDIYIMIFALILGMIVYGSVNSVRQIPAVDNPQEKQPPNPTKINTVLNRLPFSFEANKGQWEPSVKFVSRGKDYILFLTSDEAILSLKTINSNSDSQKAAPVQIKYVNANPPIAIEGLDPLSTKVNYLIGNDPSKWRSCIPTFAFVAYREVYPGIDVVYYINEGKLEFDFIIAPGADPGQITIDFDGIKHIQIAENGDLILSTPGGQLHQCAPKIYQEISGIRQPVKGYYAYRGKNRIGFQIAEYAANYPLVIDPTLEFSSYLGGSSNDYAMDIAADNSGNIYVAGYTHSPDFPTTASAYDTSYNLGYDAFVVKIDTASSMLDWATYLGGTGNEKAYGIDVDASGSIYLTGDAGGTDFPIKNAFQPNPSPLGDAFVTKLANSGAFLVYSSYLGANGLDVGYDVAVDNNNHAIVVGNTGSSNLATPGAYQTSYGGLGDAFMARISSSGSQLEYATYLGGNGLDEGSAVAVDDANNIYITGTTYTGDFPTTGGAYQENKPGGQFDGEAFAAKFSSGGSIAYVTYLGGSGEDRAFGIAANSGGNAFITGQTASADFPALNAYQSSLKGAADGFVTKLNTSGSNLDFSTYLGGDASEAGTGIGVDAQNRAYTTGITTSGNFPTQNAIQSSLAGGTDAFLTLFASSGNTLELSSYFGGSAADTATGITVDSDGNFYFSGYTLSGNFPTVNAFQSSSAGGSDAFIAWVGSDIPPITDCNNNGVADSLDISNGTSQDCNNNGIPDECDIASGTSGDCNNNGIPDDCDIADSTSMDCNNDGIPDECQLNGNDCNNNGIPDDCDIAGGMSNDCNNDGIPDDCQLIGNDCNNNGIPDDCEGPDCNTNGILDECETLINSIPTDTNLSINVIPDHDHSSEPVCDNYGAAISVNGRIIAFESTASNLVPEDTNKVSDIFVYDTQTGTIGRVSVSSTGEEGNGDSFAPSISDDGQLVAFASNADNLVPNDSNGGADVFVHNRQTGVTERADVSSAGNEANVGVGRNAPMISGDGRYVAFPSPATNLIPNDSTFNQEVFVRDLQNGLTTRPVLFLNGTAEMYAAISQTGRFLTFSVQDQPQLDSLDTNFFWDIYIHDRDPDENGTFDEGNGITELISVSDSGQIGNDLSFSQPYASADGRYVIFGSQATNLVPNDANGTQSDIFIRDRLTGTNEIVSVSDSGQQANDFVFAISLKYMSDDARFVTFETSANNLVAGDTNGEKDIFLRDRQSGTTVRISLSDNGSQANGGSYSSAINATGKYAAFTSAATNLVPNDTDNVANIFLTRLGHVTSIKGNEGSINFPNHLLLMQNYPNPFNPETKITFEIPQRLNGHRAVIKVFDLLGKQVKILFEGKVHSGVYELEWDGTDPSGKPAASGIYFYRITVGANTQTRKMILMK